MPLGQFWQLTHDGSVIVCAVTRQGAIDSAAVLLNRQLADPDAVAGMRFVGLAPSELLPTKPAEPLPGPLPSKIDFAEAKRLVGEQWLPIAEERVGTAVRVVDELCVEYEWGWVIHWRPAGPPGSRRFPAGSRPWVVAGVAAAAERGVRRKRRDAGGSERDR
ncbi:MAG TPA: hypothetical protein VH092_02560 [Urbifossiella sp.]|jgi:hypothetical protein|nr:hypothetical protein [Urbifossiella sp.]